MTSSEPEQSARPQTEEKRRRRRWPWVAAGAVLLAAGGAWLALGFFGLHYVFIDDVVEEAGPEFDSGVRADEPETTDTQPPPDESDEDEAAEVEPAEPVVMTVASGMFNGVEGHSGSGTATILSDGAQQFVRFEEDFSTENGPDLFVYLGTGSGDYNNPAEYVELDVLRGNIGSQNYEIPATHPATGDPIDLDAFDHVAVWCKRFDTGFAVAELSSTGA